MGSRGCEKEQRASIHWQARALCAREELLGHSSNLKRAGEGCVFELMIAHEGNLVRAVWLAGGQQGTYVKQ